MISAGRFPGLLVDTSARRARGREPGTEPRRRGVHLACRPGRGARRAGRVDALHSVDTAAGPRPVRAQRSSLPGVRVTAPLMRRRWASVRHGDTGWRSATAAPSHRTTTACAPWVSACVPPRPIEVVMPTPRWSTRRERWCSRPAIPRPRPPRGAPSRGVQPRGSAALRGLRHAAPAMCGSGPVSRAACRGPGLRGRGARMPAAACVDDGARLIRRAVALVVVAPPRVTLEVRVHRERDSRRPPGRRGSDGHQLHDRRRTVMVGWPALPPQELWCWTMPTSSPLRPHRAPEA